MDIKAVWEKIEAGETVYWANTGYKIYVENVPMDLPDYFVTKFQVAHHTFKDGKVLSVRCIENYFGGLIAESELSKLFVETK